MVVLFFMMIMVMVVMIIIGHHAKDDDGKHYQRTVPRDRFSTLGPLLWLCALHHFIFQFTSDINCFGQKFDSDKKLELTIFLVLWNHYMSLGCDSLFSFPSNPPWQEDGWSFKFRFVFSPSKNTVFLVTLIFQLGWIQSLLCFIRTGNFQDGWPRPKFYFWIILLLLLMRMMVMVKVVMMKAILMMGTFQETAHLVPSQGADTRQ